jgi:hypothetical protein
MHPLVCYLQKDIIWDSTTRNNQKETEQTLMCQHLFLFVVGGITTCSEPFLWSSSGVHEYYLASQLCH